MVPNTFPCDSGIPNISRKSEIWKIWTSGCPTVRHVHVHVSGVSIHHPLRPRRVHYLGILCRIIIMTVVTSAHHISSFWQHSAHHHASSRHHATYFPPPRHTTPPEVHRLSGVHFALGFYVLNSCSIGKSPWVSLTRFRSGSLRYRLVPL